MRPPRILLAFQHYHAAYHEGAARYARKAGWTLDSLTAQSGEIHPGVKYDGIIVHAIGPGPIRDFVEASAIPTVDITGTLKRKGVPRVMHDYQALAIQAATYFIENGWRNLAFYITQPFHSFQADREPTYWPPFREHTRRHGRQAHLIEWQPGAGSRTRDASARFQWLCKTLPRMPKPLAVWAWDDFSAVELLDACLEAGLSVPGDVAVLGTHNDVLVCDFAQVPLSSLDSRRSHHTFTACQVLDGLIHGRKPESMLTRIAPASVVERQSTGLPNYDLSPGLIRAMNYIRANFRAEIPMTELARISGMSVRLLQLQFLRETGRSPTRVMAGYRLEHARKLLLDTNLNIGEVAEFCGYVSASAFTQFFTREEGFSPREFRKKRVGGKNRGRAIPGRPD